ncbi:MAG: TrkA C-terminal domain-containing protein, partial [Bacteroidaceae bacterium]
MMFVMFVIAGLFKASVGLALGAALIIVLLMVFSRRLKKQSIMMERTFIQNLRLRDMRAEYMGEKKPEYVGRLLSRDLHLTDFEIPLESLWAGKTLKELGFREKYDVHVVSILRGKKRINIPGASSRLYPGDKIQAIGTDEQLNDFNENILQLTSLSEDELDMVNREMNLKQFMIDDKSIFLGKTIKESGIRDKYKCLVVGLEHRNSTLKTPDVNVPFEEGDIVWVVGEKESIKALFPDSNN